MPLSITSRPHRLEVTCAALGVPTPPCDVDAAVVREGDGWRLTILAPASADGMMEAWARALGAVQEKGRANSRSGRLVVHLDRLPTAWRLVAALGTIESLRVRRDGLVAMTVSANDESIQAALQLLGDGSRTPAPNPGLTPRQAEILAHCIERGYYTIPRRVTLRTLGAELGITATSLSLALRRAEAKIVKTFVVTRPDAGRTPMPVAKVPGPPRSGPTRRQN